MVSDVKEVIVAIISDTHSYLDSRIKDIVASADMAVHAGDIGNADILKQLQPKSGEVIAVTGNNDHPVLWPADQTDFLNSIPEVTYIKLPGGTIALEHGDKHDHIKPSHQSLRAAHPESRLVVYGHTHKMVIDDESIPWVANPGAAGSTRTNGGPSCLLLKASEQNWAIEVVRFQDN